MKQDVQDKKDKNKILIILPILFHKSEKYDYE